MNREQAEKIAFHVYGVAWSVADQSTHDYSVGAKHNLADAARDALDRFSN